jgi:cytidylate kinase
MILKMARLIITIDGPAASGKSTAARLLARKLGAAFLDTGAMYRAVTLAAMRAGVDLGDSEKLLDVLRSTELEFAAEREKMSVRIDGDDVTDRIRHPDVTTNSRYVASAAGVREELVRMQREFAARHETIVTEGRDQGTVAFPNAHIKFYLTADKNERAKRRQAELGDAGAESLEQIREAIGQRDKSDHGRGVGPLRPAHEAVIIDTTDVGIDQMVQKLFDCVKKRCPDQD